MRRNFSLDTETDKALRYLADKTPGEKIEGIRKLKKITMGEHTRRAIKDRAELLRATLKAGKHLPQTFRPQRKPAAD